MLKIFVTGDNHIGLRYARHEKAALLSSYRTDVFEEMVDAANRENCTLFVITGDLFESTRGLAKRSIKTLLDSLSRFNGTVAILPGNHDYYDKDVQVWQIFEDLLTSFDNIMLLSDYRPYKINSGDDEIVLYPALCTSLHSLPGKNNLDRIREIEIPKNEAYHIGIAHGAVEGETIDNEGQYFLMTREELDAIPVDLWLIGHTHVPFPRNLTEEFTSGEKIFNAGTHVQTDVSCNTEGQCFIIEIDESKNVRAKKFASGKLRFYRKSIAVTAGELKSTLSHELSGLDDMSVVDLIITGSVHPEEYANKDSIIESALSRFIEGTYNDYGLNKLISKELIDAEFPETSFSAGLLTALLDNPKEAQLVYELLSHIKEGK